MATRLAGGGNTYLAVLEDGKICGGINLVLSGGEYSWGLFFKPNTSGFVVCACAFSFLEFAFTKSKTLNALVKNENENALKFDRSFGFAEVKKDEKFSYLRQDLHHWQEHKMTKFMQKIQSLSSSFEIKIVA